MPIIHSYLIIPILLFLSCCSSATVTDPIPEHDSFIIHSSIVGESRTINVWTPPQYKLDSDLYPVMYMADGGIQEDFPHIANTFAELIQANKIPPMILVGIENTQRRRDLTGPTFVAKDKEIAPIIGGSDKFRAFIEIELIDSIGQRYRTSARKGILGESLSGLFVMETFFLAPHIFDVYIAFDPSLWWNDHYLVKSAKDHLEKFTSQNKVLWFAGSDATDISLYTKELAKILQSQNLSNLEWTYSDEPNEQHHTIFRATKEKALIMALNPMNK